MGAFGHLAGARHQTPMMMHCCTANCGQGLYYAWEGIVRREADGAVVNLWLNRRSPWVDVMSWLPHEGRLVVQNKGMKRISVRKPGWTDRGAIRCRLDGTHVAPAWRGNRMVFERLNGSEQLVIETPCKPEKATYTLVNIGDPLNSHERYEIAFKGHSVVEVKQIAGAKKLEGDTSYGEGARNWYRLFRREHMRAGQVSTRATPGYV